MQGLMQEYPLTLPPVLDRAERIYADRPLVYGTATGLARTTYGEWADMTRRLGSAFDKLGLSEEARVGTFAWNTARHLALYWAAPCSGRVLHTLNIRLFPEQLTYIVNHAEDEAIFVDRSLLPVFWPLVESFGDSVKHIVIMDDGAPNEIPDDPRVLDFDELIADCAPMRFSVTDENRAAAMCYTSGTTGNPKGVVYSHRSMYLHSLAILTEQTMAMTQADTVLPVVPMFHANAWGLAQAPLFCGATLVMPGPLMQPKALAEMLESEKVTLGAGVPTIWMGVLPELEGRDTSHVRALICGGSAVPKALSEAYREKIGLPITQAWGMTETSPLGSVNKLRPELEELDEDAKADYRARAGYPPVGVDIRIVEPGTTDELPWDDKATGELQCHGPWIAGAYYGDVTPEQFTDDGWLRTGDVAAIDQHGSIRLVDRTKDLIKTGGEWISSVDLENAIMAHPAVAEAAVIGVPHPKWAERPLACVVLKPNATATKEEILEFLAPKVAKWWLPDDVVFIDEVPKTSVGKFSKKDLRTKFADYELPTA